ncbi:hypothetical protein CWE15_05840 [Aliidiomarina taiwanensis]|uniref:Uncharacterized protein n=1 Tax=Aliidiomarina taiwanensis TaxID=946228 RepID=A0A432X7R8_9GAMM|nr:hypothetical protein [Aliidiomarina taiwanensis]RUO42921.1 hypothetical protein CWE15_05840 [Aliidiomarina taiwanensis]
MDGITNHVARPQTPINTSSGGLSQQGERQTGAEAEQQEMLKEQGMINQVAQYQARGNEATAAPTTAPASVKQTAAVSATGETNNKEPGRAGRAPNWSQLSAHVNGYTHVQRAMNLYQHINKLA